MQPKLGWVWLSQSERKAAELALSEVASDGTRDELGFSVIHFAYADRFFPGTSVQHTKLRYAWFVCWAYLELRDRHRGGAFPIDSLNEIEDRTGHKLMEAYGRSDGNGIIGGRVLRASRPPVTKPSRVYWNAMKIWGLLAPIPRTAAPPNQRELHWHWDDIVGSGPRPELDPDGPRKIFIDPPPVPAGWANIRTPLTFNLDPTSEADRLRTAWRVYRDGKGGSSLMSRLADQRKSAPKGITSRAVLSLCSQEERESLVRAELAASLVCVGRALHSAMIERMKHADDGYKGHTQDDLDGAVAVHGKPAIALDLGLLEKDVPFLRELKPLLAAIQNWIAGGAGDFSHLIPIFTARETTLKPGLAFLAPSSVARRREWVRKTPLPLTYRWEKVASFLNELAATA